MKTKAIFLIVISLISFFAVLNHKEIQVSYAFIQEAPEMITKEEAKQKIEARFADYDIEEIEYLGELQDNLLVYNFKVKFKNAKELCVQVTEKGGYILTIGCFIKNIPNFIEEQQCLKLVQTFVQSLGFKDLKAIWSTRIGDETVVNLAPIVNDVIIYPDLMKVRVDCKTGEIISLEARSYLYDYIEKTGEVLIPNITYEQAKEKIDKKYIIQDHKLVLMSTLEKHEVLAYEIKAALDDYLYYFYVDAETGEIIEVTRAIS